MPDEIEAAQNEFISEQEVHNRYFDRVGFVPAMLARELMQEYPFKTPCDTMETYVYDQFCGLWRKAEGFIRNQCNKKLGNEAKAHRVKEVVVFIQDATHAKKIMLDDEGKPHEVPLNLIDLQPPTNLIPLETGIFDWIKQECIPFSPDYFFTKKHPIEFDFGNENTPAIDAFFKSFELDEGDILFLKEFIAYSFLRQRKIKEGEVAILLGAPDSGKSKIIEFIEELIGVDLITHVSLQQFAEDKFSLVELANKCLCSYADLKPSSIKEQGTFKMATGNDAMLVQEKFGKPFSTRPYAKYIYSANELPPVLDPDDTAFFTRLRIIKMNKIFPADSQERDPNIVEKITTPEEKSAFFNQIIKLLPYLLERKSFTGSQRASETMKEWMLSSDPAAAFLEEYVENCQRELFITKVALYSGFREWCTIGDRQSIADNTFAGRVKRHTKAVGERPRLNGKQVPAWMGIRWKKEPPEPPEKKDESEPIGDEIEERKDKKPPKPFERYI